jgi:nitrite reductase (cytochrome c-552)
MNTKTTIALGFVACAAAGVGIGLLTRNITQRQAEAMHPYARLVPLNETVTDPAEWGKNFPRQYDTYKRTVDMERTRYGGSEADPDHPGLTTDKLKADPRLKKMWNGYAFAVDFREERGHAYMLQDQLETERVKVVQQPGSCVHCHASTTVAYRAAGIAAGAPGAPTDPLLSENGQAQLNKGFETLCGKPYQEAVKDMKHPVSCIDCHDPDSLALRVTRPGFINGIRVLAEADYPVPHLASIERWRKGNRAKPYDPNAEASRQEMRSFVCAQCHVEYYFRGEGKLVTYPWHKGLKVEQMLAYYDEPNFKDGKAFKDWEHKDTGAPMIKAQHPEFELWNEGTHARAGVACADCHMPYMRDGATKVSNHHVSSPLLHVSASCLTCHRTDEKSLLARVETIQDRTHALMSRAMNALSELIDDIAAAKAVGATAEQLAPALKAQREAAFRVDYVNAENSMGFHAPQEAARILGEACDIARKGQLDLARGQTATTAAPVPGQ